MFECGTFVDGCCINWCPSWYSSQFPTAAIIGRHPHKIRPFNLRSGAPRGKPRPPNRTTNCPRWATEFFSSVAHRGQLVVKVHMVGTFLWGGR